MASSSKPTPRQNFTKAKSPHLLESSFDVIDRSASRPNSSLATPTYMSTVQYKSAHSSLKRTRSNSSIPTEGPKSINTGEKTTSSPVNFQLSVHGVSPKEVSNLAATTSLQLDKGTSDDISMRNRNKNSSGNRMLSSNGWAGQKKFKGNHNLLEHSQSEFQRNKSPMHSRENKRSDSISKRGENVDQNKSQMKDLVLGYSKSVSYGIAESETPGSTQRTAGLTKRNKFQTPVFVIDCESDLKENKEGLQENMNRNNIETPHVQSPYTIMPLEKSNQNIQAKKTSRGSSVKRSNQGLDEKKNEKRGKENELVDESQTRERGPKQQLSGRAPTNSFFNKKTDLRPPSRPSTTKASLSTRREEPSNFSEYSSRQLDTPTDLEASARILSKIRPQMLHAHSATATPKNYFVPKTTSSVSQSQRNSSPRSSKTPRSAFLQTQPANTEILNSIQPSKNSEFSFKMTYFKPIEDSKLDEFIRDVNDSYFPKKDPLNKTSEKNRNMTEPTEAAFSTPLPSTGVTSKARSRYSGENSKDEGLNITGEIVLPDMKTHGSLKKTMTMDYKNSSNLMEKTMVQETHGKPPKPRSNNCTTNKVKEERQSTTECVPERAVSPSFEKKNMMSAEKPKVKDMNTKIESKARTTYSKLDKLLQEIKSNPGNKQHDEEGKPDSSELEKELFGQSSSKGISSSSSTNCSISKSYAHTLMKVTST